MNTVAFLSPGPRGRPGGALHTHASTLDPCNPVFQSMRASAFGHHINHETMPRNQELQEQGRVKTVNPGPPKHNLNPENLEAQIQPLSLSPS